MTVYLPMIRAAKRSRTTFCTVAGFLAAVVKGAYHYKDFYRAT